MVTFYPHIGALIPRKIVGFINQRTERLLSVPSGFENLTTALFNIWNTAESLRLDVQLEEEVRTV